MILKEKNSTINDLVAKIKLMATNSRSEEDVKIGLEEIFKEYFRKFNINIHFKHEVSVYEGRIDSLYQSIVLEYKKPNGLKNKPIFDKAISELKKYLRSLIPKLENPRKLIGIAIDGFNVVFVRSTIKKAKMENGDIIDKEEWNVSEIYEITPEILENIFLYFRSLSTKILSSENITEEFGLDGQIARDFIKTFYNLIESNLNRDDKLTILFAEWSRIFGIIYGKDLSKISKDIVDLEKLLGLKKLDFKIVLFSIHTYLVLLMKFISAEILMLSSGFLLSSFVEELKNLNDIKVKNKLQDLENGDLFKQLGIRNFYEGDFFSWYLDLWNKNLANLIRSLSFKLAKYEPATIFFEPRYVSDLLKELYQFLIPKKLRHDLGEYYTPDWLADLTIEESGYNSDINKRILDPACGSGTFLVRIIMDIREKIDNFPEKYPNKAEILYKIVKNVVGLDINPLAIISARTNYILALGDLLRYRIKGEIELPIFLCDSILTSKKKITAFGEEYKIITAVGEFHLNKEIIKREILQKFTSIMEEVISQKGNLNTYLERLKPEIPENIFNQYVHYFKNIFKKIKKLDLEGKNRIWLRILKNSFAPVYIGKFDFIVGNPPWIRWAYLSEEYKRETLQMWKDYGLFSLKGFQARLGGGEKDFSMLFLYTCCDYYLEKDGILSFLITQEVFKAKGAGEGFRRFQLGEKEKYLKVLKVHDLVKIKPFENASNKTSLIVIQNNQKTTYPVTYYVWTKELPLKKDETLTLELAKESYNIALHEAKPVDSQYDPWLDYDPKYKEIITKVTSGGDYTPLRGASTEFYGIYWVDILDRLPDGNLLITNLPNLGKKKGIDKIEAVVEPKFLYPAVRGRDIKKWNAEPIYYSFIVQNPEKRKGYDESYLQINYPKTYSYFLRFQDILLTKKAFWKYFSKEEVLIKRSGEKELQKKYKYIQFDREKKKKGTKVFSYSCSNESFYTMFNISQEMFFPFLVVWRRMGNKMMVAVVSTIKTEFLGEKKVIPADTTAYMPFNDEDKAHFFCAFLNSEIIDQSIKAFSSEGRGFCAPSVIQKLNIPKYNSKNKLFQRLVELSKNAHKLAKIEIKKEELKQIEKEINKIIFEFFK